MDKNLTIESLEPRQMMDASGLTVYVTEDHFGRGEVRAICESDRTCETLGFELRLEENRWTDSPDPNKYFMRKHEDQPFDLVMAEEENWLVLGNLHFEQPVKPGRSVGIARVGDQVGAADLTASYVAGGTAVETEVIPRIKVESLPDFDVRLDPVTEMLYMDCPYGCSLAGISVQSEGGFFTPEPVPGNGFMFNLEATEHEVTYGNLGSDHEMNTIFQRANLAYYSGWSDDLTVCYAETGTAVQTCYSPHIYVPLQGDANGDGFVDFTDFLILAAEYNNDEITERQADFDGDNQTNFSDFLILSKNYGR